ncbi:MAG: hypothetical protein JWN86_2015 [Planctomycetota bacterium]|nr:hypothetical protein [Planctomycetota bacterium]
MSIPEEEEIVEPIVIRDEPGTGASRSSARAKGSDSTVAWGIVALVGMTVAVYVIVKPPGPGPVLVPSPSVAAPEPEPVRVAAPRPARTIRRPAAIGIGKTDPRQAAVVNHVEKERKAVDPREGFETGEAFDNPPSPGRYGARSSGLLERATPTPRPNMPDPSFGRNPQ